MDLSQGLSGIFGGFNFSGIIDKIWNFIGIFLLIFVLGAIITAIFVLKRKKSTQKYKIGWWEEVNGKPVPTSMDEVEEIIIPGTPLRIFHNKEKDLWLPRFTRGITPELFYVLMTPTRQMVNFTLAGITEDMKKAKLKYDHTDMLWAAENAREFIKRNYKDKAVKWWQLYQTTIATVALLIVFTFCFILIIYFMRGVVQDIGSIASQLGQLLEKTCVNTASSGVARV